MRVCAQPSCPTLVDGSRYCAEHAPRRPKVRRSAESARRQKLYGSRRWREFSRRYLAANPTCARCGAPSQHTDHVAGGGPDGPGGYDPAACQPLCHPCHSHKTAIADGSFGRPRLDR